MVRSNSLSSATCKNEAGGRFMGHGLELKPEFKLEQS